MLTRKLHTEETIPILRKTIKDNNGSLGEQQYIFPATFLSFTPLQLLYINSKNFYVSHNKSTEQDNNKNNDNNNHVPEGSYLNRHLNSEEANLFGLCLFESNNSSTLISDRAISRNIKP